MPSLGQRPYSVCRAAHYPRLWPPALAAALIAGALVYLLAPPYWQVVIGSAVLAVAVMQARWAFWRWRHPAGQCAVCKLGRDLSHVAKQREVARWQ
jgi:hypothetical protein